MQEGRVPGICLSMSESAIMCHARFASSQAAVYPYCEGFEIRRFLGFAALRFGLTPFLLATHSQRHHHSAVGPVPFMRLRASHSDGDIPRRCVKTRVRAVALVYPTAVATSFKELPLRNIVWAIPSRR
jgi:hypothetical protein